MVQFKLPDSCSDGSLSPQRERISFHGLPKTPAPAPLSPVISYVSTWETESEEDDSGYFSRPPSQLSFRRRDFTPTTSTKAESLLTTALKRYRETARTREPPYTQQFVDEQVDIQSRVDDYDDELESTDGGAAFYAQLVAHAATHNKPSSLHQPPVLLRLATNLMVGIKQSIITCFGPKQPQPQQPLTCGQEPLLTGKQATTITYVPAKPLSIPGDAHHPFLLTSSISDENHRLMQQQLAEIPPNISWVNDRQQLARAGPLGLAGEDEEAMSKYLSKDTDWICCECSGVNSRWEFLCSQCGAHTKVGCCEAALEEVDGTLRICIGV